MSIIFNPRALTARYHNSLAAHAVMLYGLPSRGRKDSSWTFVNILHISSRKKILRSPPLCQNWAALAKSSLEKIQNSRVLQIVQAGDSCKLSTCWKLRSRSQYTQVSIGLNRGYTRALFEFPSRVVKRFLLKCFKCFSLRSSTQIWEYLTLITSSKRFSSGKVHSKRGEQILCMVKSEKLNYSILCCCCDHKELFFSTQEKSKICRAQRFDVISQSAGLLTYRIVIGESECLWHNFSTFFPRTGQCSSKNPIGAQI